MTASQHFLLSFVSSIVGALLLVVGVFYFQSWFNGHGIPATLLALGVFIVSHLLIRWGFREFIPITCPRCGQKRSYAITGRSDRFRCEVCGMDT